ncbi:Uncharacterised protein [Legionella beliardensis]|uniref:Uncharacterized protein n=1 Tax=Legionella beliardensis TaxID=91822 RepID=A0A378I2H1_9GAMM|nr:hypothetical protein [Legionella beliardensis]STX28895.1 Uncharacterised protein [Legionella beliardensis]
MKQPFESNLKNPNSQELNDGNLVDSDYYFYEEEVGLREHCFIILNEMGTIIGAGRKPEDGNDESFLVSKNNIIPSTDQSTHAYIVIKAEREIIINGDRQKEALQIVAMRGFIGKDSAHNSIYTYLTKMKLSNFKAFLDRKNIKMETDYYFSGECQSKLTIGEIQKMIGHTLTNITFNSKGTATERYQSRTSPPIISYIPESCMSTHEVHKKFDKYLKLHGPEYRRKVEQGIICPSSSFSSSSSSNEEDTTVDQSPTFISSLKTSISAATSYSYSSISSIYSFFSGSKNPTAPVSNANNEQKQDENGNTNPSSTI